MKITSFKPTSPFGATGISVLKIALSLCLVAALAALSACTEKDVAKAGDDIAIVLNKAVDVKRELLDQGLITKDQSNQMSAIMLDAVRADREMIQFLSDRNGAGALTQAKLLVAAINRLNDTISTLPDTKVRQVLGSVLATADIALSIVEAYINQGGK